MTAPPPASPAATLVGGRLRPAAADSKDVAAAAVAARAALPGWSGTTVHERGRVLFGVADLLDAHRDRLAGDDVDAAVDRWRWYAGWTDKLAGLLGAAHAGDGAVSWTAPRPVGVVGVVAPASLLGLVDALAPVLVAGATAVVVGSRDHAWGALAELLAATDVPAGVVNLLPGDVGALAPALERADVDGVDGSPPAAVDPALARLRAWSATTSVWHPAGR